MKQLNTRIEKLQNNSQLTEYFEKIAVKNRRAKKGFLESAVILSYILYIINDDNYLSIIKELSNIDFFDDYNYWTWIEGAICLLAHDNYQNNQHDKFSQLKAKLDDTLNQGKDELMISVKKNVHQCFLTGAMLDKERIISAINRNDTVDEINRRLPYIMI